MQLPIYGLVTKKQTTAYNTYKAGRKYVKTLPEFRAFTITAAVLYGGSVWVRSGAGDWYLFSNDMFYDGQYSSNSNHSTVRLWPSKPTPWSGSSLSANSLYAASKHTVVGTSSSWWQVHRNFGVVPLASGTQPT